MITLLLMISLLNATPQEELIKCTFLDEYTDFLLTTAEQHILSPIVDPDDIGYLVLEPVEFLPSDIESTCDFME